MSDLIFRDEVYAIIGAAMAVHSELGSGFLEAVYHEALEIELKLRGIPYRSQATLDIQHKGHVLKKQYMADLLCYDTIILELKATKAISPVDEAQLFNYLKATGFRLGLIINFGSEGKLQWDRYVR